MARGGSWNNNDRNARCAYRDQNDPANINDNIGFRVVLLTLFPSRGDSPRMPEIRPGPRKATLAVEVMEEWRSAFLAAPGENQAGQILNSPAPAEREFRLPSLARGNFFSIRGVFQEERGIL